MTPERFLLIDELFHLALARPLAERLGFIRKACATDDSLCEEVTLMVEVHERSGNLLNKTAYEILGLDLASELTEPIIGQTIGHYQVLELISVGMGNVYLALDTSLRKKVALKVLPLYFSQDDERVLRFEQEARLASATDHPNICVIHEINKTADGRHFIAMEYIDGPTLRERIAEAPLTIAKVSEIGTQIAWALEAAHTRGIVHRDIKPENVMLRQDGFVKVLDFGIAKLNEDLPLTQSSVDEPLALARTEYGKRMGTLKYMSPEQLELPLGEAPIDGRSDIWSLGVVLHEMAMGVTPFEASTNEEIVDLILNKQPSFPSKVPAKFQQIVNKALNKNREERYQTVRDLAIDLEQLQREKVWPPIVEYLLNLLKQHTTASVLAGVTTILGIATIVSLLLPPPKPFQKTKITQLTYSGKSVSAAISPDGKTIAYAEEKDGGQELRLTSSDDSAKTSLIVPATQVAYSGLTFTPDGNYLYFTRKEQNDIGILYQVALPGGSSRKIKDDVDGPISFSPAGDRFAFVRSNQTRHEYSLVISSADGTEERVLATKPDANTLTVGPAWSPDGKSIVCARGAWTNGYHASLVEFDESTGSERPLITQTWYAIFQVAWHGNNDLIVSAKEQAMSPKQLWRVSYPGGESTKITSDTMNYDTVSLSRDGDTIVSAQSHQVGKFWLAPHGHAQLAREIASTVGRVYGVDWTHQGRILFSSMSGNNLNISVVDADGSNQTQLTANSGDNYTPAVSPDGRYIVFASNRKGSLNIWRINADGSDPTELTFSDGNSYPTVSADGRWVFYDNQSNSTFTIWKVPIDGGPAIQLTEQYTRMPTVSPDGKFFACRYQEEGRSREIVIFPLAGGTPIERLPIPVMEWQRVQWELGGHALTYVQTVNGIANVWRYDLVSRSSRQLSDFKTDEIIFAYAWSPDYKQLACHRGTNVRDVMVIKDQS